MEKEVKQLSYSTLRKSFVVVKDFIENETGETVTSLDTKLAEDLKLWGYDNADLLERFVKKFNLDHKSFDYDKHFESEGELFSSAPILTILSIIFLAPFKLVELLSFNKINFGLKVFWPGREIKPLDLTFRDMLTWYLEGQF